ncbi:hypothetical protein [Pedobacter alpinus]|uniref:SnoaL-like domain-containing protein n=1 Tax=Pedobacter alpinus TaxID=1590643 RepID=A0ABW5TTC2_9SPHI
MDYVQDVPYDNPNPYNFIEIDIVNNENGEVTWKWGKLEPNMDASWKEFSYKCRVKKENDLWRISYLQGFDFEESTRKDGKF